MTGANRSQKARGGGDASTEAVHRELSRYRYCTTFFVEGEGSSRTVLEADLAALGDSLLVVGAGRGLLCTPMSRAGALSVATASGRLGGDRHPEMMLRRRNAAERLSGEPGRSAAVAVCAGAGNRRLLRSLGAACVDGGRFMNPSTAELLAAPKPCSSARCCCCRTTGTCSAAEEAARASAKEVRVIPTRTLQAVPPWSHSTRAEQRRTRST